MLHAGIGATHVNAFLSSLNIPPLSEHTLTNRQREVGNALEYVANKSCKAQAEEERRRAAETQGITEEELQRLDHLDIAVSYDMMWFKRGRAHKSLSGILLLCLDIDMLITWGII